MSAEGSPSNDSVEGERVVRAPDGTEITVPLSRIGPNRFRFETLVGLVEFTEDEIPEDAGMGWILEADELEDGSLRFNRVVPDPTVQTLGGMCLPGHFSDSSEFEGYGERIVALGGNWEVFAHGLFSAYVPKERADDAGFHLKRDLVKAIRRWREAGEGAEEGPPRRS